MSNSKNKMKFRHVDVQRSPETSQILLPDGMQLREAVVWLERKMEEEERVVSIHEEIDAYPLDGAHALASAIAEKFGWTNLVPTPGFFGDTPPQMIGVQVGPHEMVQVPWGRMQIPGVQGYLACSMHQRPDGTPIFLLTGEVRRKHEAVVAEIADLVRAYVRKNSIYRGKAIKISFPDEPMKASPSDFNPKFLDTEGVKQKELIFADDVMQQIEHSLFTPIERTDVCREIGIPLKRGVLLAGPYGTGKTLTAHVASAKCVQNDWTFIYLEKVEQLPKAIQFAKTYGPAMIFAEDIDEVMKGGRRRDSDVNSILNTIDGIDNKQTELIVCLTTNHVDKINQAMLRPGRLDAVITVTPPDADAALRLVKLYARDLLDESEPMEDVGKLLAGKIPAIIREVVERSKLGAVSRMRPGDKLKITAADLKVASKGMDTHLELLKEQRPDERSDMEKAADVLGQHLTSQGQPKVVYDSDNGVSDQRTHSYQQERL